MTDATTLLVISGDGVAPYSARGLTQSLEPINAAASVRRTINGGLMDLSAAQFRKFRSVVSCDDQQTPAFNDLWPGQSLTVDCVAELTYKTSGGSPSRTVVPGSSYTDGSYTFYRPRLTMKVISLSVERDEYGAQSKWSLELEES